MVPIGHYRNLDDPQSFVWFREFSDMRQRRNALEAFYLRSREWLEHREAANATMIDSDNVLLLRPAREQSGFDVRGLRRPGTKENVGRSCAAAVIFMLERSAQTAAIDAFEEQLLNELQSDARRVAYFVTEEQPNDFPGLPVREAERAFVVTGICDTVHDLERWMQRLGPSRLPEALRTTVIATERLRLEPAARSLYR